MLRLDRIDLIRKIPDQNITAQTGSIIGLDVVTGSSGSAPATLNDGLIIRSSNIIVVFGNL